jgi:polysaccharide export outer membrane protein
MVRKSGHFVSSLGWAVLALGLAGLGCQGPVGSNIFGSEGPDDVVDFSASGGPSRRTTSVAARRLPARPYGDEDSGIIRTAYQPRGEEEGPAPRTMPGGPPLGPGQGSPYGGGPLDHLDGMPPPPNGPQPMPRELQKTYLPPYVIEPPDVLFIDAIRIVPRPPYIIEPLDVLLIQVSETLLNQPINGPFPVAPDGTVNLGYSYGQVRVAGRTLEQAAALIERHLRAKIREPQVAVALAQFRGVQQTRGEHLVSMDGTITLGTYGCVPVVGLTIKEAKCAIEKHLSRYLLNPEISLSMLAYNSKVYYVIIDGGGYGQQVFRFPITGNETVLDAISQINGLPPIASKRRIWVARPTPCKNGCYEILPVNWQVITQAGDTCTNYQLLPGDRVFVKANPLIAFNNYLTQVLLPIENLFGATILGAGAINAVRSVGAPINNATGVGVIR